MKELFEKIHSIKGSMSVASYRKVLLPSDHNNYLKRKKEKKREKKESHIISRRDPSQNARGINRCITADAFAEMFAQDSLFKIEMKLYAEQFGSSITQWTVKPIQGG